MKFESRDGRGGEHGRGNPIGLVMRRRSFTSFLFFMIRFKESDILS